MHRPLVRRDDREVPANPLRGGALVRHRHVDRSARVATDAPPSQAGATPPPRADGLPELPRRDRRRESVKWLPQADFSQTRGTCLEPAELKRAGGAWFVLFVKRDLSEPVKGAGDPPTEAPETTSAPSNPLSCATVSGGGSPAPSPTIEQTGLNRRLRPARYGPGVRSTAASAVAASASRVAAPSRAFEIART